METKKLRTILFLTENFELFDCQVKRNIQEVFPISQQSVQVTSWYLCGSIDFTVGSGVWPLETDLVSCVLLLTRMANSCRTSGVLKNIMLSCECKWLGCVYPTQRWFTAEIEDMLLAK